ncbi:DUF3850 domain-containing protein [Vibrio navarrensis]|nr:DUF3850 domain-containing protein [Vibrio navarrensis]
MSRFKIHQLKVRQEYFLEVLAGRKTHEVRRNDRDYKKGDVLNLCEIEENGEPTGQQLNAQISHVLQGGEFGIADGWCVLSLTNATHTQAKVLIEFLRDRLQETCDCIEAGYEITQASGRSIADSQMTVKGGRAFVDEANLFLSHLAEV